MMQRDTVFISGVTADVTLIAVLTCSFLIFLLIACLWISTRNKFAEAQEDMERLDKKLNQRLTKLDERFARIEGAIFFGPAAVRDLQRGQYGQRPETQTGKSDPPDRFPRRDASVTKKL